MTTGPQTRLLITESESSADSHTCIWPLPEWSHLKFSGGPPAPTFTAVTLELPEKRFSELRWLLRDADAVLTCGGTITLRFPDRLTRHVLTELTRVFSSRYEPLSAERPGELSFRKQRQPAEAGQDNRNWSVAVMSGGNNDSRLQRIIDSIISNQIVESELLIVGPKPGIPLPEWVRHIPFSEDPVDCRFPICAKKNLAAREARFENLLIIHDRIYLHPEWYAAMKGFRTDWQALSFPCAPHGTEGIRMADWTIASSSSYQAIDAARLSQYHLSYPFNFRDFAHRNISYDDCSPLPVLNGACFAVRRSMFLEHPLPEWLHWAEIEDGHWSMQIFNSGVTVSLAPEARLVAENEGRYQSRSTPLDFISRSLAPLRQKLRRNSFVALQQVLNLMNREQDIFSRRGAFSKSIRTLDAPARGVIESIDWSSLQGILIRRLFETQPDVRTALGELSRSVPEGKRIYLELASCGFRFFRRSEHMRNGESLLYELACVLKNDFVLEHVFCSQQHNFLFQLIRRSSNTNHRLEKLLVHAGALSERDRETITSIFPESTITWTDSEELPVSQIKDHDLLLNVGSPLSVEHLRGVRQHYERSGIGALARGNSRVLDDCLLVESSLARALATGLNWSKSDAFRTIMEYNLILRGVPVIREQVELK